MTVNDLMVGDWVYVKDYPTIKNIQRIRPEHFVRSLVDIEPIPLTPEILEKNGFEKQWQDNYEYINDDENLNITFHPKSSNYTNGAYDYIDIEKGCLTINEMPIKFVHELQRALRILETNKDIVL